MTVRRSAVFPWAPGPLSSVVTRQTRAILLALVATLIVAVLSAAAPRSFERFAPEALPPQPARVPAPRIALASTAVALLPAAPSPQIESLAALVAKKYRISLKVTRDLIVTAYREGGRNGVDPLLIIAVMAVESNFNPIAESNGGAMGLMQVIPGYHKDKFDPTVSDPVLDPHANISLGARVLKEYIKRAGTEVAGLQLYNGSADDASNAYANKVLGERQRLQQAIARGRERERV